METVSIPLKFKRCDWNNDIYGAKSFAKIRFERSDDYRLVEMKVYLNHHHSSDDAFVLNLRAQMNAPTDSPPDSMTGKWYAARLGVESAYTTLGLSVDNIGLATKALNKARKELLQHDTEMTTVVPLIIEILQALKVGKVLVQACDEVAYRREKTDWQDHYVLEESNVTRTYMFTRGFCEAFEKLCKET